ncbi:MAG: UvrD-helicase domain-containing protein, partial [Eubacteriales bacterium]
HLQSQLESKGIKLCAKTNQEVMEKLVTGEENRYIRKLLNLVCRFISNFKVNGYVQGDFNRMQYGTKNVRTKLFLEICEDCYLEYQRYLKENKAVDFQDMINESVKILEEVKEMKQKLDFKYIIVDEYQDISRQRFDLTTMLAEVTDAKIIAVGDDWQSIYAFSGSDISLFTDFQEKMGYAELLKIVKTYRNSQEVIDIAGSFIQKNKGQMIKQLQSNKQIVNPVIIYTYDSTYKRKNDNRRTGVTYAMAYAVEVALKQIITYTECEQRKQGNILILGRFGFDGDHLEKSGLFEYIRTSGRLKSVKYPKLDITFMTAHASKGLGYDNVIVMNGKNELYGFPSKIEDDPVLSLVLKDDHAISYAEERRLFYVAMTRTKQRVYFIAPEQNPSEFLLEIKQNYKNVILRGRWNESPPKRIGQKTCPICGYPMQLKYKNGYGLRLYICTNEPEICGFMTNSYQAGKLHIMKCNQCQDGYLIAKKGRDNEYFLGCSNYKRDNSGCKNKMSRQDFYAMMGYPVEEMRNNSKEERLKNKIFQPAICLFEPKLPDFGQVMDISGLGKQMVIVEGESVEAVNGRMQAVEKHKNIHVNNENKMVMGESIEEIHEEMVEIHPKEMLQVWYHEQDLNQILTRMLNALLHISSYRYYGIGMYLDILMGEESKRIRETKLNKIPEYGILHKMQREELTYIVNWMIQNEWILQTKGRYPVLHPTYKGMHYSEYITKGMLEKLKGKLEEMRIKWI